MINNYHCSESDYNIDECMLASKLFNLKHGNSYMVHVCRFLSPNIERDITNNIKQLQFKERQPKDCKSVTHCFLSKKGLITDHMYKLYDIEVYEYVKFLSTQLEIKPEELLLVNIQELRKKSWDENRADFNMYDVYTGYMHNPRTNNVYIV